MKIHVVVFVDSGLITEVGAFKSPVMATRLKDEILKEYGDCIELSGWTDPEAYTKEYGDEVTEIDGKHYHVNIDDDLGIYEVELPHARNGYDRIGH